MQNTDTHGHIHIHILSLTGTHYILLQLLEMEN